MTENKEYEASEVNYIIAQSSGYSTGYEDAVYKMLEEVSENVEAIGEAITQSFLRALVTMGREIEKTKARAKANKDYAQEQGYEEKYSQAIAGWMYSKGEQNGESDN